MKYDYRFAVIGDPIEHSLSPQIHQNFAKQCHLNIEYEKLLVPLSKVNTCIDMLIEKEYTGINVTLPNKQSAWQYMHDRGQVDESAILAKAANTLCFKPSKICFNTDGQGLITDINNRLQYDLSNKSILILGAGGATRGILHALLSQNPAKVVVANRNAKKAETLQEHFPICGLGLDRLKKEPFQVVINATSASLTGSSLNIPSSIISKQTIAYDLMYSRQHTSFEQLANSQNAAIVSNGLGMLVEQAALAFNIWTGCNVETSKIFTVLND